MEEGGYLFLAENVARRLTFLDWDIQIYVRHFKRFGNLPSKLSQSSDMNVLTLHLTRPILIYENRGL